MIRAAQRRTLSALPRPSSGGYSPLHLFGLGALSMAASLAAIELAKDVIAERRDRAQPGARLSASFRKSMNQAQVSELAVARSFVAPEELHSTLAKVDCDDLTLRADSLIGLGTYGTVHEATHVTLGDVAVKIVPPEMLALSDSLADEIHNLTAVSEAGGHPNIVKLFGMTKFPNGAFGLVFELVRGGELYEHLALRGAFSERDAARVAHQLLSALNFLHTKVGIVHADVKPENVLVTNAGTVKLCDFGSSATLEDGVFKIRQDAPIGTVAYLAPEMLRASTTTASANIDSWALGCLLFVILSGKHPFDADGELGSDEEMCAAVLKGQFNFADDVWDDISNEAKDLISLLLDKDPTTRPNASDVLGHPWLSNNVTQQIPGSAERLVTHISVSRRQVDAFDKMVRGEFARRRSREVGAVDRRYSAVDALLEEIEEEESATAVNGVAGLGVLKSFSNGDTIFSVGDYANNFYFIDVGGVVLLNAQGQELASLKEGDCFGEIALLSGAPRNATAVSVGDTTLVAFDSSEFFAAGGTSLRVLSERRREDHLRNQFSAAAQGEPVALDEAELLFDKGDHADAMYVIDAGIVAIEEDDGSVAATRTVGDKIGEIGVLDVEHKRSKAARCVSKSGCVFKKISSEDVTRMMKQSKEVRCEVEKLVEERSAHSSEERSSSSEPSRTSTHSSSSL